MNIKSQKDFFSGLVFVVVGTAYAIGATNYKIGEAARMGPGYFPLMLGILLAVLGVIITFKALVMETVDGDKVGQIAWKPLFFIISGNLVFGVLLGGLRSINFPSFGLIVAIYALVTIASMAGDEFKLKEALVNSTILAAVSYFAFVWGLNLQFPVWPSFLVG